MGVPETRSRRGYGNGERGQSTAAAGLLYLGDGPVHAMGPAATNCSDCIGSRGHRWPMEATFDMGRKGSTPPHGDFRDRNARQGQKANLSVGQELKLACKLPYPDIDSQKNRRKKGGANDE